MILYLEQEDQSLDIIPHQNLENRNLDIVLLLDQEGQDLDVVLFLGIDLDHLIQSIRGLVQDLDHIVIQDITIDMIKDSKNIILDDIMKMEITKQMKLDLFILTMEKLIIKTTKGGQMINFSKKVIDVIQVIIINQEEH